MNRRVLSLIIGSLLLPLGCGGNDDPTGPAYATLAVATTSLPDGVQSIAYSGPLAATGGDASYSWAVTVGSLPTGLSLTTSTGLISGTPSAVGSQTFTVQVMSGDGQTATQQLTITVKVFCSAHPDNAIATFEDANLEAAIRAALSVGAQEDLTCGLISGLTELDASSAGIGSLAGIQNLTSLTKLFLHSNSITDISALSGLTSLTNLKLHVNLITDISALSGLTSLTFLSLGTNSITDISALSGLTSLTFLRLDENPDLSDIQPLLDNTGLGVDDEVFLQGTSVSCTDVAALQAKGVRVNSGC